MTAKTNRENTLEQERRFTILEQQGEQNSKEHKAILLQISSINDKLDKAIENKADKTELEKVADKVWWVIGIFAAAFVGVIGYLIQAKIK